MPCEPRDNQTAVRLQHLNPAKGRNKFRQGIQERAARLLEQRHEAHANDRLRHRVEAEECSKKGLAIEV